MYLFMTQISNFISVNLGYVECNEYNVNDYINSNSKFNNLDIAYFHHTIRQKTMAENIHSSAFYTWQPSYGSIGDPNEDLTEDKVDDSQEPEEPQFNPSQDPLSSSSSISSQPDITTYSSLDTFIPDVSNNYRKGNIDLLIIIHN